MAMGIMHEVLSMTEGPTTSELECRALFSTGGQTDMVKPYPYNFLAGKYDDKSRTNPNSWLYEHTHNKRCMAVML